MAVVPGDGINLKTAHNQPPDDGMERSVNHRGSRNLGEFLCCTHSFFFSLHFILFFFTLQV